MNTSQKQNPNNLFSLSKLVFNFYKAVNVFNKTQRQVSLCSPLGHNSSCKSGVIFKATSGIVSLIISLF